MKVSQRLQQIDKMITRYYDHIWDCCCDHGLLGLALLQRKAARKVHFVDVVEPLMLNLQVKLQRFFVNDSADNSWQVHCMDVAKLPLTSASITDDPPSAITNHLIIIAGVGGELTAKLVQSILTTHPQQELEFLLCPVHHNYKVRQALTGMGLGLINERLIRENNRFYEIIHVSTNASQAISPVGSKMWDFSHTNHQEYFNRTIAHYQRMSKSEGQDIHSIIADYQALQPEKQLADDLRP